MWKTVQRKWGWILAITLLTIAVSSIYAWVNQTGCFSYANFERIQVGMSREEVADLLGSFGQETTSIPGYPPYVHLPGAPPGWTGVVWGDTFVHWEDDGREIYVGFSNGRVTSTHYWEPSL
jgi:hypothetical protein